MLKDTTIQLLDKNEADNLASLCVLALEKDDNVEINHFLYKLLNRLEVLKIKGK